MANEVGEQLGARVTLVNVVFGKNLIGEVGTGFKCEFLGEDKGVIAVEEEVGYLMRVDISECDRWEWGGGEEELGERSKIGGGYGGPGGRTLGMLAEARQLSEIERVGVKSIGLLSVV